MKVKEQLGLALRFFLGSLVSYFVLFTFVSGCIFSLLLLIDSYEQQIAKRFASKQAHFTLLLDDSLKAQERFALSQLKQALLDETSVLSVSEFVKSTKWLRLTAATSQLSGIEAPNSFDKFSNGQVTLIGLQRVLPAVIPLDQLHYYDAGSYKFKITNLEYAAQWLLNPNLILPNAVLDESFYAPISQQVSVKQDGFDYQGQIKAYVNDYADESILYMGIDEIHHWLNDQDIQEKGLYIRLKNTHEFETSKESIQKIINESGQVGLLSSWLDQKSKQRSILLTLKLMGYGLIILLTLMLCMVLTLNQTNVFIKRLPSLNILYMTGYLLTIPLVVLSVFASSMGVLTAYLGVSIWITPLAKHFFANDFIWQQSVSWVICLFVLILVNVINFMGIQGRLGFK